MSEQEAYREKIERFFAGVIVNGCARTIVFLEEPEEGRVEVDLVAPPQVNLSIVHLSFPVKET